MDTVYVSITKDPVDYRHEYWSVYANDLNFNNPSVTLRFTDGDGSLAQLLHGGMTHGIRINKVATTFNGAAAGITHSGIRAYLTRTGDTAPVGSGWTTATALDTHSDTPEVWLDMPRMYAATNQVFLDNYFIDNYGAADDIYQALWGELWYEIVQDAVPQPVTLEGYRWPLRRVS